MVHVCIKLLNELRMRMENSIDMSHGFFGSLPLFKTHFVGYVVKSFCPTIKKCKELS